MSRGEDISKAVVVMKEIWEDYPYDDLKIYDNGTLEYFIGENYNIDVLGFNKVFNDFEFEYGVRVELAQGRIFFDVTGVSTKSITPLLSILPANLTPFDFSLFWIDLPTLEEINEIENPKPVCKFREHRSGWEWYLMAGEKQANGDYYCFGFVKGLAEEYGYFMLSEILSVGAMLCTYTYNDLKYH